MEKTCKTCKYNVEYPPPHTCDECDSLANESYYMWESKEEKPLKGKVYQNGEFYVKLVCDICGKEVEISKVRLEDFADSIFNDLKDSIYKSLEVGIENN